MLAQASMSKEEHERRRLSNLEYAKLFGVKELIPEMKDNNGYDLPVYCEETGDRPVCNTIQWDEHIF